MSRLDGSTGTSVTLVVPPGAPSRPAPEKPLPHTGFSLLPVLVLAAALLAVGVSLVVAARRRPSS